MKGGHSQVSLICLIVKQGTTEDSNTHQHVGVWIKPPCYPGNLSLLGTGHTEMVIMSR